MLFEGGNHKDKAIGTLYRNFESPPKSDDVKKKSTWMSLLYLEEVGDQTLSVKTSSFSSYIENTENIAGQPTFVIPIL